MKFLLSLFLPFLKSSSIMSIDSLKELVIIKTLSDNSISLNATKTLPHPSDDNLKIPALKHLCGSSRFFDIFNKTWQQAHQRSQKIKWDVISHYISLLISISLDKEIQCAFFQLS